MYSRVDQPLEGLRYALPVMADIGAYLPSSAARADGGKKNSSRCEVAVVADASNLSSIDAGPVNDDGAARWSSVCHRTLRHPPGKPYSTLEHDAKSILVSTTMRTPAISSAAALEENGFDVRIARRAHRRLQLQRRRPADLLITDIFMRCSEGLRRHANSRPEFRGRESSSCRRAAVAA